MYVCTVLKVENMKTIKSFSKVTMLLAFVAFANTLMASGNLKLNILPLTSEKAVVAISNNVAANFQISIENNKGEKVYYKETRADAKDYRKIFDFSELEKGDYTLTVSVDGSTALRNFKIGNDNISVSKEKTITEPYFAFENGVLKVSYLNFPEENLNLNFFKNNELVYTKEIGNAFNVIEGFDLSQLEKGGYSVVLSGENNNFTYNVDVE
jgi:hypothetical protein